jgi:histidinol-phosphatase
MLVAEGALDVALEAVVDAWDVAAVQVIVEEAGGRFSDFAGDARIDSGTVVTSNGLLHDSVLGAIRDGT